MGDWSDSLGMNSIKRLIEDNTPEGMYVHSLKIGGDGSGIDSHVRLKTHKCIFLSHKLCESHLLADASFMQPFR